MFEILKDSEASVKDLAAAYSQAMTFEEKLISDQTQAKHNLVSSQLDCLQKKPSKLFLSAKEQLDNIFTKIEAVRFGRKELKTRIGDRLQVETQKRLEQIQEELAAIASEKRELQEAFLSTVAKAAILKEQIEGRSLLSDSQGRVTAGIPSVKVEFHLLDGIDGAFYSERIKRYRQESPAKNFGETIRGRESSLVEEQTRLQKMLEGDPRKETEQLLTRLIPPPPPEPAEVAGRPKSHPSYESKAFEKDYSGITVEY